MAEILFAALHNRRATRFQPLLQRHSTGNPKPAPGSSSRLLFPRTKKTFTPCNEITQIIYWILDFLLWQIATMLKRCTFFLREYLSHSDSLVVLNFFFLHVVFASYFTRTAGLHCRLLITHKSDVISLIFYVFIYVFRFLIQAIHFSFPIHCKRR